MCISSDARLSRLADSTAPIAGFGRFLSGLGRGPGPALVAREAEDAGLPSADAVTEATAKEMRLCGGGGTLLPRAGPPPSVGGRGLLLRPSALKRPLAGVDGAGRGLEEAAAAAPRGPFSASPRTACSLLAPRARGRGLGRALARGLDVLAATRPMASRSLALMDRAEEAGLAPSLPAPP